MHVFMMFETLSANANFCFNVHIFPSAVRPQDIKNETFSVLFFFFFHWKKCVWWSKYLFHVSFLQSRRNPRRGGCQPADLQGDSCVRCMLCVTERGRVNSRVKEKRLPALHPYDYTPPACEHSTPSDSSYREARQRAWVGDVCAIRPMRVFPLQLYDSLRKLGISLVNTGRLYKQIWTWGEATGLIKFNSKVI